MQIADSSDRDQPSSVCVLAVDDNQAIVELIFDALSDRYEVTLARGGYEALEKLQESHCDAMLVDLGMPDMSGIELIRHVRADPRTKKIPIVVMSAYPELQAQLSSEEVQAILPKPFGLSQLYRTLERVLETPH